MFEKNRFEGILVYEDGTVTYARNANGRILFRFNAVSKSFGIFRSSRMTEDEMDFCIMMLGKFLPDTTEEDKQNCIRFMKYEIDINIFCS